ncbi:MAG TPA: ABC transporter ATP-binding protein [Thermoplasmatales archaeon]|nr:ABC transporter ATP-binding protein [Thermoplasmatales archaeon]
MISIKNLRKEYGTVTAVDGISFEVKRGEVFALLGPNGAGKTTTIKAILGLIQYEGDIFIDGMNARENKKRIKKMIGYLPEKVAFYDNLTALQTLQFYAELKGIHDADLPALLKEVNLERDANRKVGGFSKGMVQRLGLAQSLLGTPELLILDEPTTGLDALGAFEVRTKIRELSEQGNTILLSSHILSEVQELSHRVAILNKGSIVAIDTVENLSKKLDVQPKLRIELEHVSDEMVQQVSALDGVRDVTVEGNVIEAICPPNAKLSIIKTLEEAGGTVVDFKTVEPSLEEIFIKVVKDHV